MFVDEIQIHAKAGDGGDGVVRWRQEKFKPKGGPAGGNGGKGGDVYIRAVRDLGLLGKYKGAKVFKAENGEAGRSRSQFGKGGEDRYIDLPVGSKVTDIKRDRVYDLHREGQTEKILQGGNGGLGNEYFKSSTNRSPLQSTKGKLGEEGEFNIELALIVDVGLVGLPNAGKSTLLNALTNANSTVGSYEFTTLEPHLGDFHGYLIADIPGLIEGASLGKGLGHKFLRHIKRTKMLFHLISLENEDVKKAYYTISNELANYDKALAEKEQWIILTKKDLISKDQIEPTLGDIDFDKKRVFVVSCESGEGVKKLADSLVETLRKG